MVWGKLVGGEVRKQPVIQGLFSPSRKSFLNSDSSGLNPAFAFPDFQKLQFVEMRRVITKIQLNHSSPDMVCWRAR